MSSWTEASNHSINIPYQLHLQINTVFIPNDNTPDPKETNCKVMDRNWYIIMFYFIYLWYIEL